MKALQNVSDMSSDAKPEPKKGKMENESKYLPELLAEKDSLDSSFTHAMKLISAGNISQIFWLKCTFAVTPEFVC